MNSTIENRRLLIGKVLILLGFLIGLKSLSMTFDHIGDLSYVLIGSFTKSSTHTWYHAFRELIADISTMVFVIYIYFFVEEKKKTHWWGCFIVLFGFYAPFWIGAPFMKELAAPHWRAELVHILMAGFPLLGLVLSRKSFKA